MAVRNESVRIDLDGNLVAGLARAAVAARGLRAELDGLGRVRISSTVNQSFTQMDQGARRADGSINQLTGRLGLFADAALILGPGLVPLAAVGASALGGLTIAAAATAFAAGSAVIAFQGIGDATKAIDAYQLDPTVENLQKAKEAMRDIGPQAQRFVKEFQAFQPVLTDIQRAAAKGWFPGLTDSLDDFARLAPRIEGLFMAVGRAGGDIVNDTAESLASRRWTPFLKFLEQEAPDAMRSLATITGDLTHGLSEMLITLDPANDRFLGWLEDVADGFDNWARSSRGRDDLQGFMEYARENGPEVEGFFLALVDATTQIVQAAAPLGGPVLSALTKMLEVIAAFADSDLGTPFIIGLAALRLYTRGLQVAAAAQARLASTPLGAVTRGGAAAGAGTTPGFIGPPTREQAASAAAESAAARNRRVAGAAAGAVGVGFLMTGAADELDATNTATLALAGSMAGPLGAGIGAAVGGLLDLSAVGNEAEAAISQMQAALDAGAFDEFGAAAQNAQVEIEALHQKSEQDLSSAAWKNAIPFIGPALGGASFSQGQKAAAEAEEAAAATESLAMEAHAAQFALGAVAGAVADIPPPIREAVSLFDSFVVSLKKAQGFLDRNSAIDAYEASIDALTKSIKDNGRAFDKTSEKGRANRAALRGIAESGLTAAEKLNGLARVKFMDGLRGQFREAAKSLGLSQQQTQRWMNMLGILDRQKASPEARLLAEQLEIGVRRAEALLNSLNGKSVTTYVITQHIVRHAEGGRGALGTLDGPPGTADGGTIPGQRRPYGDKVYAYLAPGEEVISNRFGQADRHRSLLKAINSNSLADGGTARAIAHAARSGRSGGAGSGGLNVNLGDLRVSGVLNTPWGPAQVEGIARATAREEIAADREFAYTHGGGR